MLQINVFHRKIGDGRGTGLSMENYARTTTRSSPESMMKLCTSFAGEAFLAEFRIKDGTKTRLRRLIIINKNRILNKVGVELFKKPDEHSESETKM